MVMNTNFLKKSSKSARFLFLILTYYLVNCKFFTFVANFDIFFVFIVLYLILCDKRKGVFTLDKLGTVTVSVFKNDENHTDFSIEVDDDSVLPVSYVIEDTLKLY